MTSETPETSVQTEAFKAYEQTWQHIDLVIRYLLSAQFELSKRIVTHDRTKLLSPEREKFAQTTSKLWGMTYGSPEYNNQDVLKEALAHHYEYNRHHPQFFEPRPESDDICNFKTIVTDPSVGLSLALNRANHQEFVDFFDKKQAEHVSSINNMNLFDLIEMFVDWTASSQRHADGDINKSIEINTTRFALSPQLVEIFKNTIPWVQDAFPGLNNQQDIQPPN